MISGRDIDNYDIGGKYFKRLSLLHGLYASQSRKDRESSVPVDLNAMAEMDAGPRQHFMECSRFEG